MPDGIFDDDNYGAPTLTQLKQMSWDIGYIRDKLALNGVLKDFVWKKSSTGAHHVIVGKISTTHWNMLGAFRNIANRIANGEDGPAPPVTDFGQSNYTQTQLTAMYNQLNNISSKVMFGKRTFIMRYIDSNVELYVGDISAVNASYRSAIASLSNQIDSGNG